VRGQIAHEHRLTPSILLKLMFHECLCFQHRPYCDSLPLAMLDLVQAMPLLAFLLAMEPPLGFWYDRQQVMRTVAP